MSTCTFILFGAGLSAHLCTYLRLGCCPAWYSAVQFRRRLSLSLISMRSFFSLEGAFSDTHDSGVCIGLSLAFLLLVCYDLFRCGCALAVLLRRCFPSISVQATHTGAKAALCRHSRQSASSDGDERHTGPCLTNECEKRTDSTRNSGDCAYLVKE